MKVELFRMASEPITIEVEGEEATIKQVLSAPGSGKVLGEEEKTLIDVATCAKSPMMKTCPGGGTRSPRTPESRSRLWKLNDAPPPSPFPLVHRCEWAPQ